MREETQSGQRMQGTDGFVTDEKSSDALPENEELTGINNPLNRMEKGTDKRNPIIRILEKFGDLFVLNLIFVLACIPVVTIGAAVTALFTMTNKMVRNEEGTMWNGFWKAFRNNFKIGTKLWFIILCYLGILYMEFYTMQQMSEKGADFVVVLIGFEMVLLTFVLPLLFPMVARYENTVWQYVKNALLISISNLKVWFIVFFMWAVPAFVMAANAVIFAYTWYLWFLILFAIFAYATSMVMQGLFDKLEAPKETDKGNDA